ncbi:hypothetical protein H310_00995 [Aphanomyces invadans]|uniref:Uncharacterized protein n=1 Tax=Aphanomyces invadans TaxID=157072 RepID=A0A024UQI5_9STRA|nr:hypothetical protein H310_00995 [Aphanomyces invadans]ETW08410.1 hypothetical protein H310_00995 [Aphanomyces invadans]|eukprot:XP_008862215.1 hypothetical protein H310_00995 [Aphanomyces invadans]
MATMQPQYNMADPAEKKNDRPNVTPAPIWRLDCWTNHIVRVNRLATSDAKARSLLSANRHDLVVVAQVQTARATPMSVPRMAVEMASVSVDGPNAPQVRLRN